MNGKAIIGLFALAVAGGCGSQVESAQLARPVATESIPPPVNQVVDAAQIVNDALIDPLNNWYRGGRSHEELNAYIQRMDGECMRAAGYPWVDQVPSFVPDGTVGDQLRQMRTVGYGMYPDPNSALEKAYAANKSLYESFETEDELLAFLDAHEGPFDEAAGERDGGCLSAANDAVHQEISKRRESASGLPDSPQPTAEAELQAVEDWRQCMAAAGYPWASQPDEMSAAVTGYASDRASEVIIASADADCRQEHLWPVTNQLGKDALAAAGIDS